LVLRKACIIALGPSNDKRTKLMALNMVLTYTKPKSKERHSISTAGPEDWLRGAIAAGSGAASGSAV
jgi:hypothetical protein